MSIGLDAGRLRASIIVTGGEHSCPRPSPSPLQFRTSFREGIIGKDVFENEKRDCPKLQSRVFPLQRTTLRDYLHTKFDGLHVVCTVCMRHVFSYDSLPGAHDGVDGRPPHSRRNPRQPRACRQRRHLSPVHPSIIIECIMVSRPFRTQ